MMGLGDRDPGNAAPQLGPLCQVIESDIIHVG